MVHHHASTAKIETTSVPEELYNLTQLADVTLAAGKLSTETNETPLGRFGHSSAFTPVRHSANVCATTATGDQQPNRPGNASAAEQQHRFPTCSSSDEDALLSADGSSGLSFTRNYAHKIFDRRKARQQQASTTVEIATPATAMIVPTTTTTTPISPTKPLTSVPQTMSDNDVLTGPMKSPTDEHNFDATASHINRRHNWQHRDTDESHPLSMVLSANEEMDANDGDSFGMAEGEEDDDEPLDVAEGDDSDIHVCPECGKKYSTSSNLARHRQTHRSLMDKKARRCPHCDKVYVSMPAFSMHVRTHNQGCECPHCGKRFSRPWLLQGHIRTHTGEKPFECSICTKAFADKSNLRAHIQTHSNTKPHTCTRCGKSFALKSYLYKHEESSCVRNLNKSTPSSSTSSLSSSSSSSSSAASSPSNNAAGKSPRHSNSASSTSSSSSTASSSAASSPTTKASNATATALSRVLKRAKSTTDLQRKCREKLRDKLRGPAYKFKSTEAIAELKEITSGDNMSAYNLHQHDTHPFGNSHNPHHYHPRHQVTTDSASQKSYIDLSQPLDAVHYSRISVIRSVLSTGEPTQTMPRQENHSPHEGGPKHRNEADKDPSQSQLSMGFYQEMPMDFSPKASNFATKNSSSSFGITSKYAVIA